MHYLPLLKIRFTVSFYISKNINIILKHIFKFIYSKGLAFLLICLISFVCSCRTGKSSTYFQNLQKDTTLRNLVSKDLEPKVQIGDMLGISIISLSPDVALYNSSSSGAASSSTASLGVQGGYLVDGQGSIDFVKLGNIHAAGLTKKQLSSIIDSGLVPYLKNVVVNISFLNRHVTILGGVNSMVLPMAGDNVTILDALAASGDIVEKGRSDNVLVIREKSDSAKEFKRINLTNNSVFSSPYFFLKPNDIIYVEPKIVKQPLTALQVIPIVSSAISIIILILNTVKL